MSSAHGGRQAVVFVVGLPWRSKEERLMWRSDLTRCHSLWPTVSYWTVCRIFMKFGIDVFHKKFSSKRKVSENGFCDSQTLLKGLNELISVLCMLLDWPGCSSIVQTNVYVELHLHSQTWLHRLHTDCTKCLQVVAGPEYWKGDSKCNMLGAANHVVLLQVVGLDWF